jgi:lipid A 4'-phosphatase
MKKKQDLPLWSIITFVMFCWVFKTWPEIDISFSNLFFDGIKFPLSMHFLPIMKIIDRFIEFGCMALWVMFITEMFRKEYKKYGLKYRDLMRKLIYIAAVGLSGSVGAVHFIKHYIMRCRPNYIEFFGGPSHFTEIWTRNLLEAVDITKCVSFVSGHAAIGFLIYAIAFTAVKTKRFIFLGTVVGGLFGFIRIIQGQHFLSDVIFSGYVVYFSALLLSVIMRPKVN